MIASPPTVLRETCIVEDVDLRVAEDRSDAADHPRDVRVLGDHIAPSGVASIS